MTSNNKFPHDDYLFPPMPDTSRLLVGCRTEDYSASRIARAVEDCDAHLLNLNVTSMGASKSFDDTSFGSEAKFPVVFDIRVNRRNVTGVSRSLERYGYTVLEACSPREGDDETGRMRLNHLLRYLEV